MDVRHTAGVGGDDRAVSAVVGLILVFGLVVAGSAAVFVTGMDAKGSMQAASELAAAESSLEAASSALSTLAASRDDATAELAFSSRQTNELRVRDDSVVRFQVNGNPDCTYESELGALAYEHDSGVEVAYQGGAVFRQASGTTMVQSPELAYRWETIDGRRTRVLSFPVTNVSGSADGAGELVATADGDGGTGVEEALCLAGSRTDEFDYVREVTITVEGSDYYRAWHRYFEREFGSAGTYSVDHGTQTVSVTAPLGTGLRASQFDYEGTRVYGALFSTSAAGELSVQTKHATVDSFDSGAGPWGGAEPTYGDQGDVFTRGDVYVQANGAEIQGTAVAGGIVDLSSSCGAGGEYCVDGDVYVNNSTATGTTTSLHPEDPAKRANRINGTWGNGTTVPSLAPVDDEIEETTATVEQYNDNDDVAVVDGKQIQYSGGTATVEDGVYYLDELTVPADADLELNTTEGDVVLAVEGDVEVGENATVTVVGDGQVRVFVNESTGGGDQLTVREGAVVEVVEGGARTYRSDALVVGCKAGCNATFEDTPNSSTTEFTGVLYGPGRDADAGTVSLGKRVEVWGALVAGSVELEKHASFHFDTALRDASVDSDGDGDPDMAAFTTGRPDDSVRNAFVVSVSTSDVNVTTASMRSASMRPASARVSAAAEGPTSRASAAAGRSRRRPAHPPVYHAADRTLT